MIMIGTVPNWIVISESIWYHIGNGSGADRYQFRTCSKWIRSGVNASLDIVIDDMKTARL